MSDTEKALERAVVAEARAKVAEAEIVVLKDALENEKRGTSSAQGVYAAFSAIYWSKAGVMSNKIIDYYEKYFDDRARAERLVKHLGGVSFDSPDRSVAPDLRWP